MDHATRSSDDLLSACLDSQDALAWAEFVRRFHPLIASVVIRVTRQWGGCTPEAIDDLIQDTYLKLCTTGLRGFNSLSSNHRDAIYGYIKVFTANLVHDHFKASRAQKRGGAAETVFLEVEAAEVASEKTERPDAVLERKLLLREVGACVAAVTSGSNSERDRCIFWLYYRVGLPASAIATLPTINLSTKGVESTILRLTRLVRRQLTARKQNLTNITSPKGMGTENAL